MSYETIELLNKTIKALTYNLYEGYSEISGVAIATIQREKSVMIYIHNADLSQTYFIEMESITSISE